MKINDFKTEQWMNDHEKRAIYNLTDTSVKSFTWQELNDLFHIDPQTILDYGDITGSDAVKKEVLKLYATGTFDSVTMFHGCLEANQHVMDTLIEPNDHVITYVPGYQQFWDYPKSLGAQVSLLHFQEENDWLPDISELEKCIQSNTKMVIINNPNNPTGTCFPQSYMQDLIRICRQNDIWILCDEVYRNFAKQPSLSDLYEKGISTCSLSKAFGLAGLRYGWVKANEALIKKINVRRDYTLISTGPLMDAIATGVLQHKEEILKRNNELINQNKQIYLDWEAKQSHYRLIMPKTGTVSFLAYDMDIPSAELATKLLEEEGIFFVPGACFDYEHHLRLGLGQDPEVLKAGLQHLMEWTNHHFG